MVYDFLALIGPKILTNPCYVIFFSEVLNSRQTHD